jgi:hypothetical protein
MHAINNYKKWLFVILTVNQFSNDPYSRIVPLEFGIVTIGNYQLYLFHLFWMNLISWLFIYFKSQLWKALCPVIYSWHFCFHNKHTLRCLEHIYKKEGEEKKESAKWLMEMREIKRSLPLCKVHNITHWFEIF